MQYHKDSMEILRGFVKSHENSDKNMDQSINTKIFEIVKNIKKYFSKVIRAWNVVVGKKLH